MGRITICPKCGAECLHGRKRAECWKCGEAVGLARPLPRPEIGGPMEQQAPRVGSHWTHTKSGNVYVVVESFLMEHPDLGVWMPCVVYTRNGPKFARSLNNFLLKFSEVEWG